LVTGSGILPVRRARRVTTDRLDGVVVDIDPTEDDRALAVLQAGLHDQAPGHRLVFGYEVVAAGLGGWVGDRVVRVRVWPALVDASGAVIEDRHDDPDGDVLALDFDPTTTGTALAALVETGRLFVAGPDIGPTPLVLDLDRDLIADVVAEVTG
jgi:hypothetical protein